MLFNYGILNDSILCEDSDEEHDLEFVEASSWEQDGKYQSRYIIFKHNDKFYRIYETRSGSPFSDWDYEDADVDSDGNIECEEVIRMEVKTYRWI